MQLEARDGFCFEMLKMASQESVVLASRQLAAIQLKNIVKRRWKPTAHGQKKGLQPLPEQDKKEIMTNLHECVVRRVVSRCMPLAFCSSACPAKTALNGMLMLLCKQDEPLQEST